MEWFKNAIGSRQSDEKLRDLYAELLLHINASNRDLKGRQQADPERLLQTGRRRLSLRRSLRRSNALVDHSSLSSPVKVRDLVTAFHILSATPAPYKEGINGGAVAVRDRSTVAAISTARSKESHVVNLIRQIGELVAYGDQPGTALRSDSIFEYFCEKDMLALLVDIAKAQPLKGQSPEDHFHEVSWSPHVKAQVLQTVSVLVSNTQDPPSLYYLLSNNHLNELVMSMLPLTQWSNHACEEMLPVYAGLLKSLAVQLSSSPGLFSFLTVNHPESLTVSFPVFSAAIEVWTSLAAQSDSLAHNISQGLILDLMRSTDTKIRIWISNAVQEHRAIALYMSQRLVDRFDRLGKLTTGPVVDPVRSNAIAGQLAVLRAEIESLNDLLWCGIRTLNVHVCECLLQRLVGRLLRHLLPAERCHLLAVGVADIDVIPKREALAQASIMVLTQLFLSLEYAPFLRMLAVAAFHPLSSTIWEASTKATSEEYSVTKALNRIASQELYENETAAGGDDSSSDLKVVANPFREELLSLLRGDEGDWRFIAVSLLFESAILSEALDIDTFASLRLLPKFTDEANEEYTPSVIEDALVDFFKSRLTRTSFISSLALERAGSVSLAHLELIKKAMRRIGHDSVELSQTAACLPLVKTLKRIRSHFFAVAWSFNEQTGVSQLYVDLIQLAISSRYRRLGDDCNHGSSLYGCPLQEFSCKSLSGNAEILIRKYRHLSSNDVEDARFAIKMALHFRALCRTVKTGFPARQPNEPQLARMTSEEKDEIGYGGMDIADDLLLEIGDLKEKPPVGTDLDLRGRMTFRFFAASNRFEQKKSEAAIKTEESRQRTLSEEMALRTNSQLVLVLDPMELFVVNPINRSDVNRGTIVCRASLRSIIACASDEEWCHVAIRDMPDVGFLVKNGNMALRFDCQGTCLIVRQYLERSLSALRYDLMEKIRTLFEEKCPTPEGAKSKNTNGETDDVTKGAHDAGQENAVMV